MFLYAAGLDVCLNRCKCKNEKKPTFTNLLQIEWGVLKFLWLDI